MTISIVQQYFSDPISGKLLANPVINQCGHSYSKAPLNQWRELKKQNECPLCGVLFQGLIDDILLQKAATLASTQLCKKYTRVEQFTDEDREVIELAITQITQRRNLDQERGFPSRLNPYFGSSAVDRIVTCSKNVCHKTASC